MSQRNTILPTSEHFELVQLAEGIYAALAFDAGGAFSNAGIIDLGNRTVIFDTFTTPQAAEDLRSAAEQLTGKSATYIINSHCHDDHWLGNQVFGPGTIIISTYKTNELVTAESEEYLQDIKNMPAELEEEIREAEERLKTEDDEHRRTQIENSIARTRHILVSLSTLNPRFADQTFNGEVIFHGSQRTAELITFGKGHTESDCFLVLPDDQIGFMGDLAFFRCHPYMGDSHPQAWIKILEKMEQAEIETFVPGHGPLGTKADISLLKQYILTLQAMAIQIVREGGSADDAAQLSVPSAFADWDGINRFEANLRFLSQQFSEP